jgi:predicted DNA-binding transcriptional regulator AlpA
MTAPRYARNKTEAAKLAGMSRTTLYQLMRLPGFPAPRSDGRWCVADIRKFALREAKKLAGPQERDQLHMQLLNLKIQRASQELADFEQKLRDEITTEIGAHFKRAISIFASRLKQLPRDLAPRSEGLTAGEIFKIATSLLYAALDLARQDFLAHVPEKSEQQSKVVPFGVPQLMEAQG